MFMRGQIGPCAKWMAELNVKKEEEAIQEKWIKTGKMLSWQMFPFGFRIIGPKFLGVGEDQNLTLWFYTFPDFERFKEWALGAPEHIALHTKLVRAMKVALKAPSEAGQVPLPYYSFRATDDPNADIRAMRAELREIYRETMMLGDHD
jgi:hypothetical protein